MRLHESPQDESTRLALAVDGDADARAWVVHRYTPAIHRFALRMLGDEQDAHDAAQDTMIKVLRHLDRYDPERSFTTWIFGIARNTCIDEHRRRRRRSSDELGEVVDPAPGPLHDTARQERADRLHAALQELPPMYREVLVMFHFEHLKYTEIAEVLDLPLGTVMNRIFRARGKVRELLGGEEP